MDLGLEWAGFETVWQVESNDYSRKVLRKRWPDVPKFSDVRECGRSNLQQVDIITGGFPCQDISVAGHREGTGTPDNPTDRSGLWFEQLRIIREMRPHWTIIENVYQLLLGKDGDTVLTGMEEAGYTCWPLVLAAEDLGAPHERKRVWVVCRRNDADRRFGLEELMAGDWPISSECRRRLAEARSVWDGLKHELSGAPEHCFQPKVCTPTAKEVTEKNWSDEWVRSPNGRWKKPRGSMSWAHELAVRAAAQNNPSLVPTPELAEQFMGFPVGWTNVGTVSPEVAGYMRLTQGFRSVPDWRKRLEALGNAVVPQIPLVIGEFVRQFEAKGSFGINDFIEGHEEDNMNGKTSAQCIPGLQSGENISPVEALFESLDVEKTREAYKELNAALERLAHTVVCTIDQIVPQLTSMQSLLSQRGASRKKVLRKAGLPTWTKWAKEYEKKFDCTLRTIQLHIKLYREDRQRQSSGDAPAARRPSVKRPASKASPMPDSRRQAALLRSQEAADRLAAALKSGGDWKRALEEYEKASMPPADLGPCVNAPGPETDWKTAFADLVNELEQCVDRLPAPAIKAMQEGRALLEGKKNVGPASRQGPGLAVCPPAGRPEEEPEDSGSVAAPPSFRKTA